MIAKRLFLNHSPSEWFSFIQEKAPDIRLRLFFVESGNVLLSQVVSNQVPSALKGLTSVFGMGTGGSLSP